MDEKLNLAFKIVKPIFNLMQDLERIREELRKTAELMKEKKKQERKLLKELKQKRRKLKTFQKRKLPKLAVYFLADEFEPAAKLLQELKDLQEAMDTSTTEGKAMLKILNTLKEAEENKERAKAEALAQPQANHFSYSSISSSPNTSSPSETT